MSLIKNKKINTFINQICIFILIIFRFVFLPIKLSLILNIFYSFLYLFLDLFSKRSIRFLFIFQLIFIIHFIFRLYLSIYLNIFIYIISSLVKIINDKILKKNIYNFNYLCDSSIFSPYYLYLDIFYSYKNKPRYLVINKNYDKSKKSIIYFAGLFQKSQIEYKKFSNKLIKYNHIYVNFNFKNNDNYKETLKYLINDIKELNIECIVGFSFGGSLALQFKELYKKNIKLILISPGGFDSNTFCEKIIKIFSKYAYKLYDNDKWYMINNYPKYQNKNKLMDNDYLICSLGDNIHNPSLKNKHKNLIIFKNISHTNMISNVYKKNILINILN